jgi:hypothetical protein
MTTFEVPSYFVETNYSFSLLSVKCTEDSQIPLLQLQQQVCTRYVLPSRFLLEWSGFLWAVLLCFETGLTSCCVSLFSQWEHLYAVRISRILPSTPTVTATRHLLIVCHQRAASSPLMHGKYFCSWFLKGEDFSHPHNVQTGSGAHPAS